MNNVFEIDIDDIDELDLDNKIYVDTELAMNVAKQLDINLGKTTLSELLKGYTDSLVLQQRIDKAIQYMEEHPRDFMDEACGGDGVDIVISILRGEEGETSAR